MKVLKYSLILYAFLTLGRAAEGSSSPWSSDGFIRSDEYSHKLNLVQDRLVLHYKTDSTYIYLGIEAKNFGWFAIGFDPDRGMKNADIILIFVENGSLKVLDSYSTGIFGPHKGDKELGGQDNILHFNGRVSSEGYVAEFKRLLDTKDKFDRPLVKGKELTLIYAMSKSHNIKKKHDLYRGSIKVKLVD